MPEMLIEPRPPGRPNGVAGLQHPAQPRAGTAAHQAEMPAVLVRHQFKNDARFAMAFDAEHNAFVDPLHGTAVIPGRREAASPESIITNLSGLTQCNIPSDGGYGFRVPRCARPRNDGHPFGNSNPI